MASPVLDLGSTVPLSKLQFVDGGGDYEAGYLTHQVKVRDGIVTMTPQTVDPTTGATVVGGPFGIETTSVVANGERITGTADSEALTAANVVAITRNDVVEEIANRDDGIEQSWRFAAKPELGTADLVVEIAVTGQTFTTQTASGLHFKSANGLGVRYGNAVWRDAEGTAFDVESKFEDGQIVITVPNEVVDRAVFPAVLDPTISGELFTDVPAAGTTGTNSRNQDIASGGSNSLVVWQDQRDSRSDDIWGTLIDTTGKVLDANGIKINAAAGVQQNPSVAFVGNGYVVAWENVVTSTNTDIVAAFVSTSGTVTQLGTIAGTSANETAPAVSGRGSGALLVWSDGTNLKGSLFASGAFGTAFAVATTANVKKAPAVSGNPTGEYLVAYGETIGSGNDDIHAVMVSATGSAGTPFVIDSSTGEQQTPSATFDGTNHVIVWDSVSNIVGARVNATGTLLDATPKVINNNSFAQQVPDVSCLSTGCFVVWQDARNAASIRDIYGAVVTSALAVTTNDIVVAGEKLSQLTPAVAISGTQYFATWSDNRDLEYTYVRGSRISTTGTVLDANGIVLATSYSRYQAPTGTQSSVTDVYFADSEASDVNLVHVRFTGATQTDKPPKLVSSAIGAQTFPTAATVGSNSMVAWQDTRGTDRDIYASRVSVTTGLPLDTNGIAVSTATADQSAPAMASSGTSALIVWQDRRNASTGVDIYGAVISSTGAITLNNIVICNGSGDQGAPRVAYDSTHSDYLVVFNQPTGALVHINGVRVSPTGTVLDANCGTNLSGTNASQFNPDVAFGGGSFMVAWEDRRNSATLGDIYGTRVTTNGSIAVTDPTGLAIAQVANSAQTQPTVAFGTSYAGSYLVAWTDARNQSTTGLDIYGAQVSATTGASTSFAIATTTEDESAPKLIAGNTTQKPFSIAYNKTNHSIDSVRFQLRQITLGTSVGQPCSQNSQCESGFCADGVCCNAACGGFSRTDCQACTVKAGSTADGTCSTISAATHYICRDYVNRTDTPTCDAREYCDGVHTACPADLGVNQGKSCKKAGNVAGTCPSDSVSGAPHACQ